MPIPITSLPPEDLKMFMEYPQTFWKACGWKYWEKQEEIMCSVRDNVLTSVISCTGSGKTYAAAREAIRFMNLYVPCKVLVIAPIQRQVKDLFWAEFQTAYSSSGDVELLGEPQLEAHMRVMPDWFIRGLVAKEEAKAGVKDKMTGYHGPNVMIIMDQADGLPVEVWEAVWLLRTNPFVRILSLSNPFNPESENANINIPDRETRFGKKFINGYGEIRPEKGEGWNVIKIRAADTPSVRAKKDDPKWGGLLSYKYFKECSEIWEETDPLYEITFNANYVEGSEMTVLTPAMIKILFEESDVEPDFDNIYIGIDVARKGVDRSVWTAMLGPRLGLIRSTTGFDLVHATNVTIGLWKEIIKLTGGKPPRKLNIDDIGVGGGLVDNLEALGYPVEGINVGENVDELETYDDRAKIRYINKRAQVHWNIRILAQKGELCLKPYWEGTHPSEIKRLKEECRRIRYKIPEGGKIQILGKDEHRKFLKRSPDNMDSLCLGNCHLGGVPGIALLDFPEAQKKEEKGVFGAFPAAEKLIVRDWSMAPEEELLTIFEDTSGFGFNNYN